MRAIDYALRQAWTSVWRNRGATLFAVTAIAVAMIVLGALLLATWNVERLVARWSAAAEFSVFLDDTATSEERGAVEAAIDASGVATSREYVSKAAALQRFRAEFRELAAVAAGMPDNPFPASVEVRIDSSPERRERASALARQLAALPGVADVRYDREWLDRLSNALATVRAAGLVVVLFLVVAAGVTVATVVRLGLYARRAEIEIMELVGSPLVFIRGPFVAEGVLQGGLGAIVALVTLAGGYALATSMWAAEIQSVLEGGLAFLPPRATAVVVAGGMAVGGLGGLAAARHAG